jgi:L-malate glycosyltransferase
MSKPSIFQIVHGFLEGGSERQMVQIVKLLHESGDYQVHVGTLGNGGVLRSSVESLQIPIIDFPLTSFYDANMVHQTRKFVSYLRKQRIRLVHSHDFYSNIFAMSGSLLAGIRGRIASKRETTGTRTPVQAKVERSVFRHVAHAVVANATAVKVVVIHNGLDLTRFNQNGNASELFQGLNLLSIRGRPVVTIVANFEHRIKDYPMLLRAAQRVKTEVHEAVFVLAGDGRLKEETQKLASQLGLADSCLFIGRCGSVPELLAASDICVLSSQAEGFSNSILEYMAAGRAVVATNVGGASEAIVEGETGHLVKAGDDQAMAERIISLLRDPDRRRAMGLSGRRLVEEKFSCEKRLAATSALYQRFLD